MEIQKSDWYDVVLFFKLKYFIKKQNFIISYLNILKDKRFNFLFEI